MKMGRSNGFSVLVAIGMLLFVTMIASVVQVMMNNSDKGQRAARIRFMMSAMENRVRLKLNMPESWTCTQDASIPPIVTCQLQNNFWQQFKKKIPGAKCSPGVFCGLEVKAGLSAPYVNPPTSLSSSTMPLLFDSTKSIRIVYNGKELFFNSIVISDPPLGVPTEAIANASGGACPHIGDIFKGIRSDGTVICDPLPTCSALEGFYFAGIDKNAEAICKPLNPGLIVDSAGAITKVPGMSCPKGSGGSDQYIESISFNCSNFNSNCSISLSCKERVDPCNTKGSGAICPDI